MKVEIKLTADHINFIAELFEQYEKVNPSHLVSQKRESKVVISICMDVAEKFAEKFASISKKPTLFNIGKKYTLSIKYHEAHAIEILLRGLILNETDDYKKAMVIIISDLINKKIT